jgi:pimeloyl-ACP methyl ester carboxylesterase
MPSAAGLYYFAHEEQNGSRPPVILLHGAGGTHLNWPPQVRRMLGQRIYAPDLPGHGKSAGVSRQSIAAYAADLIDFMDALKMQSAVLVGHSMGAAIALTFAIEYPERLLGLGLLGANARLPVAPAILKNALSASAFHATVAMVTEACYGPATEPRLKELGARRMAEMRPSVFYGDFLACESFDVFDKLACIQTPTLVLASYGDQMTPLRHARRMQERIPGARLQLISNAGHMLMLEQPEQVATALSAFIDSLSYGPGG